MVGGVIDSFGTAGGATCGTGGIAGASSAGVFGIAGIAGTGAGGCGDAGDGGGGWCAGRGERSLDLRSLNHTGELARCICRCKRSGWLTGGVLHG